MQVHGLSTWGAESTNVPFSKMMMFTRWSPIINSSHVQKAFISIRHDNSGADDRSGATGSDENGRVGHAYA